MPGGDRTGPLGMGPRTGRVAGLCAGFGMPGFAKPRGVGGYGRGGGMGSGLGSGGGYDRGWCHRFFATGIVGRGRGRGSRFSPGYGYPDEHAENPQYENTKATMEEEAEYLKSARDDINKRLDAIQAKMESVKRS